MSLARWTSIGLGLSSWLISLSADAQELPGNVFAVSLDDEIQDILFLQDDRPVLIRLRIRVDGEGHRGRWREYVHRLHSEADADRDGTVTRGEARQAIDRAALIQATANPVRMVGARRTLMVPPQVLTVDDLADQFRMLLKPFQFERRTPPATSNHEATFRLLDRDGDGFLDRAELDEAASSLARLDRDEDEILTAEEFGPYVNPFQVGRVTLVSGNPTSAEFSDLIGATDQKPADLARLVIRRYDGTLPNSGPERPSAARRPRDEALQLEELPIRPEAFVRLDADRDGSIAVDELSRALANAADLELIIRLGSREPGRAIIERPGDPGKTSPFGPPGFRMAGGVAIIELNSTIIELSAEDPETDPYAATRARFEATFQSADRDGNGTLEEAEVGVPLPQSAIFGPADRDGDGKLTGAEWKAHLDGQARLVGLRTALQVSEEEPSFVDLLDDNRDKRVSPRELRAAPARILLEDRDGDGRVSLAEFARKHRWNVARGPATPVVLGPTPQPDLSKSSKAADGPTPRWFLKMDRNQDGDLSPREFLGTRATFDAYDADHDGLITRQEAGRPHPSTVER